MVSKIGGGSVGVSMIPRKITDRQLGVLTVPDFWVLVAAKNASFPGDFDRSGTGVEKDPRK